MKKNLKSIFFLNVKDSSQMSAKVTFLFSGKPLVFVVVVNF